jgi:hypothetical protein
MYALTGVGVGTGLGDGAGEGVGAGLGLAVLVAEGDELGVGLLATIRNKRGTVARTLGSVIRRAKVNGSPAIWFR